MSRKQSMTQYLAMGLLLLCAVADPLERVSLALKWIDELICLGACVGAAVIWVPRADFRRQIPKHMLYFIPLFVYMFMQLLGSMVFRFQPWSAVIIDGLTNAKFWLILYSCYLLGQILPVEDVDRGLLRGAKIMSVALLVMFVMERFGILFPGGATDNRWEIPCAQLIYTHPTYLAATLVLLLAVLLSQWHKGLLPFVLADLVMLVFTFRSKAYGGAIAFVGVFVFSVLWKQRVRVWQVVVAGAAMVALAWDKIVWYFLENQSFSPRYIMTSTSLQILKDFFPLGTGFGTFASHQAAVHYSPVYVMYGFEEMLYINSTDRVYMDDTFWPIVIAQSGAIGLCAFCTMLFLLCKKAWTHDSFNHRQYASILFCIAYVVICSTSEPSFNKQTGMFLATLVGYWYGQRDAQRLIQ